MTTTSHQLYVWGKRFLGDNFVGVFPIDRLPPLSTLKTGHSFIVNNQPSSLDGQHWLAVKIERYAVQVFDPLGPANYPNSLISYLHTGMRTVKYSRKRVQDPNSNECGLHCLIWLKGR